MKEQTTDKFIRKPELFFLYAQVVFSWLIILFGYGTALRVLFAHYERFADKIFYTICFFLIGILSHKFMLRASIEELHEAKNQHKHE